MIAKKDLLNGSYYRGLHRCSNIAMWSERRQKFIYIDFSCGMFSTEEACHPEDDDGYALFVPFEKVNLKFTPEEFGEHSKLNI